MLRKGTILLILSLQLIGLAVAQELNVREKVYLHLNSSFLLTGETLYFTAYNTSMATGQPSELSKILYVELIDSARNPVFQQKIVLENGRGYGHFFISSLISTGRYQLIAYTRWMKNFNDYFESTITIINPFEAYELPPQPKGAKTLTSFYPEGGKLLAEKENTVVYTITNLANEPLNLKGRVVSGSGEKVATIDPKKGMGRFTFKPTSGEKYQAILEDESGNFSFFNLPEISTSGQVISLTKNERGYRFELMDSNPTSREVSLRISDGQNIVFDELVYTNGAILVREDKLKPGSYRATMVDIDGRELTSRVFTHYKESQTPSLQKDQVYKTRSLVEVPISFKNEASFSVSVKKMEKRSSPLSADQHFYANSFGSPELTSSDSWEDMDNQVLTSKWKWEKNTSQQSEVEYLPELRGELISGRIDTENPQDITLSYSISGEEYHFYTEKPDENGNFQFQVNPTMGERDAYISVLNTDQPYRDAIILDDPFLDDYPAFSPAPLFLDSAEVARLVKSSVRNQIENAYYETKLDSTIKSTSWVSPFGNFDFFYVLDDYNRFPEMYEHFIEYIPMVVARKSKSRSKLKVLLRFLIQDKKPSLALLDGVPVSEEGILDFNPYKIESIGVINNRYFYGPLVVDGIVSLHTFEKDLQGYPLEENTLQLQYHGLEPQTLYTFPEYKDQQQKLSRIPDYREQLYWEPKAKASKSESYSLKFYTGDTTGKFEIVLEGYYQDGTPFSLKETFTVEEERVSKN